MCLKNELMNKVFQIPAEKVQFVVKNKVRQKTWIFLLILPICVLLEVQLGKAGHFQGFKGLSKAVSWLIIDAAIWIYMLFLISIAKKRFTAYYTNLRILLTDKGIKRVIITDDLATVEESLPGLSFSWNEIKSIKESTSELRLLNGKSLLIPGIRQIIILRQIDGYDELKAEIASNLHL